MQIEVRMKAAQATNLENNTEFNLDVLHRNEITCKLVGLMGVTISCSASQSQGSNSLVSPEINLWLYNPDHSKKRVIGRPQC